VEAATVDGRREFVIRDPMDDPAVRAEVYLTEASRNVSACIVALAEARAHGEDVSETERMLDDLLGKGA
jgi:hypothetical protein